ncbi:hypothetical protein [Arthrobacter sp. 131MFCol6.1]|nr:hypothetical protein [Arthrobacter sp. 131MFCol6.1]
MALLALADHQHVAVGVLEVKPPAVPDLRDLRAHGLQVDAGSLAPTPLP